MDLKTQVSTLAELKAACHLTELGYDIFLPFGGKTVCDVIGIKDNQVFKFEVKSCSKRTDSGKWSVHLKSVRHNRSKNEIYPFDSAKSDYVVVYLPIEDRIKVLESKQLHGKFEHVVS